METQLTGAITNYFELVGKNKAEIEKAVNVATNGLATDPIIKDTDPDFLPVDLTESYWLYYNAGLELQLRNDILVVVSLYLQEDNFYNAPFTPLSHQLLDSLPNTATIQEVTDIFGPPDFEGGLAGRKNLQYRLDHGKFIVFRFNREGTLWSVQLGLTRILRH